jgi:Do/DeqQ family serine protease
MVKRTLVILLLLSLGFAAGFSLRGVARSPEAAVAPTTAGAAPPPVAPAQAAAPPPGQGRTATALAAGLDFTEIAARAVPAVTNISSVQVVRRRNSPFAMDPFFQFFFGDQDLFGESSRPAQSLGSGVIVSPDGYILTNQHVLGDDVRSITVVLADGREVPARIVGVDPYTDLAVVKVDLKGLPVLPWGDSSKLRVAEWVLAIGNPFQFNQTVTLGIVSALGRHLGLSVYEDFIQTDAAINPGNSGGALVNARGELVGINTAIYSESGGYQGIGFAVPSNTARRVVTDIIRYGQVRRGSIGVVEVTTLTEYLAHQLGVPGTRGVLVSRMRRDSEAYLAGLRPGDIIVSFNGTPIEDAQQLQRAIADAPIGSTARIGIVREGRRLEVPVRIVSTAERRRIV